MHLLDRHLRAHIEAARSLGHVESWFAKLCAPDGRRAVWLKHTLRVPRSGPAESTSWLVRFDERTVSPPPIALRTTSPLEETQLLDAPFHLRAPETILARDGDLLRWSSRIASPASTSQWDVTISPLAPPVRLLPARWMYEASFPRSKTLTPVPDGLASGWVEWDRERWDVEGWRVLVGHNWGAAHPERYLWIACNVDLPDGRAFHFEAIAARVRLGRLLLPWMSSGYLALAGDAHRLSIPRGIRTPRIVVTPRGVRMALRHGPHALHFSARLEPRRLAVLPYDDPDGSRLWCLNTKLARGQVRWNRSGRYILETSLAPCAVEIGTRTRPLGLSCSLPPRD